MDDFDTWLTGGGGSGSFPSASLNSDLKLFIKTNEGIPHFYSNYIGFMDGKLKFAMIRAVTHAEKGEPHKTLNPVYEDWMDLMDNTNKASGSGMNKGTMTAAFDFTWMRSELEFYKTAQTGIIMSMTFAFIILNISTLNVIISIFSITCIALIVISVVAMMELLGWEFGVAESLAVVILIGFSVDYVVHLANHYVEAPYKEKKKRIQHALSEIGVSIFSGAITTILSGLALFFCTVTMFTKFAVLICATILLSLFMSFGLFSAFCHACGPSGTCGDLKYWVVRPIQNKIKQLIQKIKDKRKEKLENQLS